MRKTAARSGAARCHGCSRNPRVNLLLSSIAIAFLFSGLHTSAQDAKTPAVLPPPSNGKAIVCIYRVYRFTGSASHDEIFVNDIHLGKLLNSEYEFTEVSPGTVVIAGLPKMYYGSVIQSVGAALADARKKENQRATFEAEAGQTYYFKWTAGTMATDIKVTPVDPSVGAKEMSKLHPSKPPSDPDAANAASKDSGSPAP